MPPTLDPDVVDAEVEAARSEARHGRPAEAVARYRSLLARLPSSGDGAELGVRRARALIGLAAAEYELSGDLSGAKATLRDAERIAVDAAAVDLVAPIHGQLALLLLRAGREGEALRAFDRAAEQVHAARDRDQVSLLLNRGVTHMERGSLDVARADLERCATVAEAAGDREGELRARHNLGYAEFLAGRIPRALATMDRAEALNTGAPHPIGLLDRARVLREAGLSADADRLLSQAVDLFASGGLHQDLAEAQLTQSECALVEGDAARALTLARAAERTFARRDYTRWRRKAQL
ncbi:MAG: tetratricopeptide repeat protein, partial [Nocardioidaceae bacterium]|nr:tetratricopeptide repeat protein [Nocardioidaceae bacterium]